MNLLLRLVNLNVLNEFVVVFRVFEFVFKNLLLCFADMGQRTVFQRPISYRKEWSHHLHMIPARVFVLDRNS